MKTLIVLVAAAAGGAAATVSPCLLGSLFEGCDRDVAASSDCTVSSGSTVEPPADTVRGTYVEARDLAVFAGACHRGTEADSQGRAAALAWRFDGGEALGVDVAGLSLAAVVESERNLEEGAPRRAVAWVDEAASAAQRSALRAWLVEEHRDVLGELVAFEPARIAFEHEGETFRVEVAGALELAGAARADRACCQMEEQRWYEPLAAAPGAVVGVAERCRFEGAAGLAPWVYEDENNAFVTRFGPESEDCCAPTGRAALLGSTAPVSESTTLSAEEVRLLEQVGCRPEHFGPGSPPRGTAVARADA